MSNHDGILAPSTRTNHKLISKAMDYMEKKIQNILQLKRNYKVAHRMSSFQSFWYIRPELKNFEKKGG
jgi:hypothetical protein